MDLGIALSRPVRLDCRQDILLEASLRRRAELRRSWKGFVSAKTLENLGSLAPEIESSLSEQNAVRDWRPVATFAWIHCDASFSDCLRLIALAANVEYRPVDVRPAGFSLEDLKKRSLADRLTALRARYRCPLNIGIPSESDVAEELLRQLMVLDRTTLGGGAECDVDMVLLKLNLVGIRAMITRDLRMLDALNYFYELPRRLWTSLRANPRLLVFWLCIYAQLLRTPDWQQCGLP